MPERTLIRAIRSRDLVDLLGQGHNDSCAICGRRLTSESIGGVVKAKDGVRLFCDRVECISSAGGEASHS
jgi:hypothetical protein